MGECGNKFRPQVWKLILAASAMLATFNMSVADAARAVDDGGRLHGSPLTVSSPDGRLQAVFSTDDGGMRWALLRDGKTLVKPSAMGFRFAVGNNCEKEAAEFSAMKIAGVRRSSADTVWKTSLYRRGKVRDRYNELVVELEETEARAAHIELGETTVAKHPRRMDIVFRAYDEGVAFRYSFPRQAAFDGFQCFLRNGCQTKAFHIGTISKVSAVGGPVVIGTVVDILFFV